MKRGVGSYSEEFRIEAFRLVESGKPLKQIARDLGVSVVTLRACRRLLGQRVVETFFATLTKELLLGVVFATRAAASRAVFEFIEIWYNRQRGIRRLATARQSNSTSSSNRSVKPRCPQNRGSPLFPIRFPFLLPAVVVAPFPVPPSLFP